MKGLKRFLLWGTLWLMLGAGVAQAQVVVGVAPPPLRREVVPVAPGPRYVWEPGYYRWHHHRYYWVPGRYVVPPGPRVIWVPGHWVPRGSGYVWVAGYWK